MEDALRQADVSLEDKIVVLHVDDERDVCELAADFLEKLNDRISVVTETSPQEALQRIDSEPIDCVISDYQMPEMDGITLLNAVREQYPNLPFILFTGKGSEEVASDAINSGATSYVQKGGTEVYEQLENAIQNAVTRRRSKRRARIAHDRLLNLYEQTDGFYILDADWRIAYWNQQIAERTGLSSDDVLDNKFLEVFPEGHDTELYDHLQKAMSGEEATEFETYVDSFGCWVEVRAYPVDGGLFIHSRDITEKRQRDQEMERRNHILESFAHTVSHDLRNPLNVAEGRLELAKKTGDFDHLDDVARAHNRMRNLIDDLLKLARGEELALTEVSLKDIAEQAWETVSSEQAKLVVDADTGIEAHETQLQRLFENIFWNAIEHGDATTIRVGPLDDDGFFIKDDGPGIPPDIRNEVFESGFSSVEGSPGYGLSIVRGIVDTHGWAISIVEEDFGGARFEITWVVPSNC